MERTPGTGNGTGLTISICRGSLSLSGPGCNLVLVLSTIIPIYSETINAALPFPIKYRHNLQPSAQSSWISFGMLKTDSALLGFSPLLAASIPPLHHPLVYHKSRKGQQMCLCACVCVSINLPLSFGINLYRCVFVCKSRWNWRIKLTACNIGQC